MNFPAEMKPYLTLPIVINFTYYVISDVISLPVKVKVFLWKILPVKVKVFLWKIKYLILNFKYMLWNIQFYDFWVISR
jgi:hypothetical protein